MTATAKNMSARTITHRKVLAIAVPIMLSNVSTPLIGVVDTAVIGQLVHPYYIGAVAIGAMIFNFIYWAFGFLRMGTTGLTAQAEGAGDATELRATLGLALLIAAAAGAGLIILQSLISLVAFSLIDASGAVESHAREYLRIRIWSAPAALANFAILGWFIGIGRARTAFVVQIILNLTNMALDALFVLAFGMEVAGIALGTVIAELVAAAAGLWFVQRELAARGGAWALQPILDLPQLRRTIAVNGDIMIRTMLLLFAFSFFVAQSAGAGDTILAANTVLMHFISMSAFFLDGLAFAAESLVGQALGARARAALERAVKLSSIWAVVVSAFLSLAMAIAGGLFIDALTLDAGVRAEARAYILWAAAMPLLSVAAYQFDGIFIGATKTVEMRNAAILSTAAFMIAWWALTPYGNHGLWAALTLYAIARAVFLGRYYPALVRSVPA